jgi:hypothetical protein
LDKRYEKIKKQKNITDSVPDGEGESRFDPKYMNLDQNSKKLLKERNYDQFFFD